MPEEIGLFWNWRAFSLGCTVSGKARKFFVKISPCTLIRACTLIRDTRVCLLTFHGQSANFNDFFDKLSNFMTQNQHNSINNHSHLLFSGEIYFHTISLSILDNFKTLKTFPFDPWEIYLPFSSSNMDIYFCFKGTFLEKGHK